VQYGKQPLWARLQLFARLTLNAGEDAANQPARLAHLDHGNDRAILVQGDEGPAQIVRLGHRGTPSIDVSDEIAILAARRIASLSAGGNRIRTSGTAEDAGLVADLYAHNASRRIPQKGVRIRQSLACAALRREWWARRRPVRSVSDPRERAAREPAGADRAPSCSPSSGWCASNRMLPAPGCVSRRP